MAVVWRGRGGTSLGEAEGDRPGTASLGPAPSDRRPTGKTESIPEAAPPDPIAVRLPGGRSAGQ
jgi:hypothetical protein